MASPGYSQKDLDSDEEEPFLFTGSRLELEGLLGGYECLLLGLTV